MRGDLAKKEPAMLAHWEKIDLYNKQRQKSAGKEKYILHDGPPYANGRLHMGHALNKILKDMIVKSQQMMGKDAPYLPGWDCHGLPIELKVEQTIGKVGGLDKNGNEITATMFRKACRDYAEEQINIQRTEFKRFGVFGKWDEPYKTMNFKTEANIVRSLAKIVSRGHLVRGSKPVNWCIDCGSALAEAEVEYQDKYSYSIYVAYPAKDSVKFADNFGVTLAKDEVAEVVIWTTTPWTLPSSYAVSFNPELDYGLYQVQLKDKSEQDTKDNEKEKLRYFVFATDLAAQIEKIIDFASVKLLGTTLGKNLDKQLLNHPFYDRDILVINGEHVTTESGTGCVHTAPAHGLDDYNVGVLKYGIDFESFVDEHGKFMDNTPLFAGKTVNEANKPILDLIKESNKLVFQTKLQHSYPHCWRHKTPTIFRATSQWFISMNQEGLRDKALAGIKQVDFTPDWGESRLYGMIENRPDWCISRQRYWGVPLCLFVHKETGEIHPDTLSIMEKVAVAIEKSGIEAWHQFTSKDLIGDDADNYEKTTDVLDVWFDSGTTHESVLRDEEEHLAWPADLYLEGSDQHRGWFHSSLLTSTAMNDKPPYKSVLTHGFVVDENGHKMSKSLGNIIEPQKITDSLGADILRLWVSSTDYSREIRLSDTILKFTTDSYRRIRNTARFLLANTHDFVPVKHQLDKSDMLELDQYIVARAAEVQEEIISAYKNYQFNQVYQAIHNFCSLDLGSFYLDIIKDRQYTVKTDTLARRSAQTAMFHVLEAMVRWMAPILSFTADELWKYMVDPKLGKRDESVFFAEFYDGIFKLENSNKFDFNYWQTIIEVRNAVVVELEKVRTAGIIGSSLDSKVTLYATEKLKLMLDGLSDELRFVLITSYVDVVDFSSINTNNETTYSISGDKLYIKAEKADGTKCIRCWHYRIDVGSNAKHPELCVRCIDNVDGNGEVRSFA